MLASAPASVWAAARKSATLVSEARVDDLDGVDLAVEVGLDHEIDDDLDLGEGEFVGDVEVGDEVTFVAGEELGTLAADGVVFGRGLHLGDEFEEVGVERSAEALVCGDEEDAAGLDLALDEEGVLDLGETRGEAREHLGEELGVGATGESGLLGLLHLGRGDHLHRLGDLAGVFNRLDASANIAGGGHGNVGRLERNRNAG